VGERTACESKRELERRERGERESERERERERNKEGKKNSNIGIGATRQNFRCRHPQVSSQGEIPVDLNLHW